MKTCMAKENSAWCICGCLYALLHFEHIIIQIFFCKPKNYGTSKLNDHWRHIRWICILHVLYFNSKNLNTLGSHGTPFVSALTTIEKYFLQCLVFLKLKYEILWTKMVLIFRKLLKSYETLRHRRSIHWNERRHHKLEFTRILHLIYLFTKISSIFYFCKIYII